MTKSTAFKCPYCHGTDLYVNDVSVKCKNCLMIGPQMNGGRNDAHADIKDRENAIKAWNKLPRDEEKS